MIHAGLVSVTFQDLPSRQIVDLVAEAGLTAVEWSGRTHVPHGDLAVARQVGQLSRAAGLTIPTYGSYYHVSHPESGPFESILETTLALGAPAVRVWAGQQGSAEATEAYWSQVVTDSRRIADLAAAAGLLVVYESHRGTLTDTNGAAQRLLSEVDHPHIRTYWQTPHLSNLETDLAGLAGALPWLYGLHVFTWHRVTDQLLPLAAGEAAWLPCLELAAASGRTLYALLEFVVDGRPDAFREDAATLQRWLAATPITLPRGQEEP